MQLPNSQHQFFASKSTVFQQAILDPGQTWHDFNCQVAENLVFRHQGYLKTRGNMGQIMSTLITGDLKQKKKPSYCRCLLNGLHRNRFLQTTTVKDVWGTNVAGETHCPAQSELALAPEMSKCYDPICHKSVVVLRRHVYFTYTIVFHILRTGILQLCYWFKILDNFTRTKFRWYTHVTHTCHTYIDIYIYS